MLDSLIGDEGAGLGLATGARSELFRATGLVFPMALLCTLFGCDTVDEARKAAEEVVHTAKEAKKTVEKLVETGKKNAARNTRCGEKFLAETTAEAKNWGSEFMTDRRHPGLEPQSDSLHCEDQSPTPWSVCDNWRAHIKPIGFRWYANGELIEGKPDVATCSSFGYGICPEDSGGNDKPNGLYAHMIPTTYPDGTRFHCEIKYQKPGAGVIEIITGPDPSQTEVWIPSKPRAWKDWARLKKKDGPSRHNESRKGTGKPFSL
jgi:hypothetical protein